MKKKRLVINLEPDEIAKAKSYAKAKGVSLSKLTEDHFIQLIESDSDYQTTDKNTHSEL